MVASAISSRLRRGDSLGRGIEICLSGWDGRTVVVVDTCPICCSGLLHDP
jgi:hypothetical protein